MPKAPFLKRVPFLLYPISEPEGSVFGKFHIRVFSLERDKPSENRFCAKCTNKVQKLCLTAGRRKARENRGKPHESGRFREFMCIWSNLHTVIEKRCILAYNIKGCFGKTRTEQIADRPETEEKYHGVSAFGTADQEKNSCEAGA
ncbi:MULTISPECIES: hypothetical protein [Caproicibacterium]|uniref:Uncharacterized protein n=1 Tax=Caproicibacterium argilliputei TaxID=3030016 RepID=A0AA97H1D9_9FIRM|nr:hypothetical protein [Caproicibacterium argilliputei]WOC32338.1 hypothetical protein PXC00_00285 [Caproicibacterium argilliputei]